MQYARRMAKHRILPVLTDSTGRMCPGEVVVSLLGASSIAKALGVAKNTPLRWRFPVAAGGTGGVIPARYHRRLMELAASRSVKLTATDLVLGRAQD